MAGGRVASHGETEEALAHAVAGAGEPFARAARA